MAQRYGLVTKKVESKEDAGFYIDGKKVLTEELFEKLFGTFDE